MKKKAVAIFLCTALLVGVTAGCGNTGAEPEKEQTTGTENVGSGQESNSKAQEESGVQKTSHLNVEGFPIVNEQITLTVYGQRDQNQTE